MKDLRSRVALVTGGASGIGAALVRTLAARGARVLATDVNGERAEALASELRASGADVSARALDVTDASDFAEAVREVVEAKGSIDLLFNNAGIGLAGEVRDTELADWKRVIDVNLWGVIHGIDAAYPYMLEQGSGYIINTASGAGLCPRPGMTPYAAAKHAVVGLSTSLRAEAAAHGVGVSAVCPGYIRTEILERTTYRNLDDQGMREEIPIQPMSAERCAEIVLRGVAKNRAVIPVTAPTQLEWALYRLAPGVVDRIAAFRARKFAKHRTDAQGSEG